MTATTAQTTYLTTLTEERAHRILPTATFEDFAAAHVGRTGFTGTPGTLPEDLPTEAGKWDRAHDGIMTAALADIDPADRAAIRTARKAARAAQQTAYYEGYKVLADLATADPSTLTKEQASAAIDFLKTL